MKTSKLESDRFERKVLGVLAGFICFSFGLIAGAAYQGSSDDRRYQRETAPTCADVPSISSCNLKGGWTPPTGGAEWVPVNSALGPPLSAVAQFTMQDGSYCRTVWRGNFRVGLWCFPTPSGDSSASPDQRWMSSPVPDGWP